MPPGEGGGPPELGKEAAGPADGAGEKVGEAGEKKGQVQVGLLCRSIPTVDVDEVARSHEEVKREAGGEEQVQGWGGKGQPGGGEDPFQQVQGKGKVFDQEEGPEEDG